MRIVFLGSGAFAIPSFLALLEAGHDLAALVTQPDREKGRGRALAPPPLKPVAQSRGVRVLQPRRIKDPDALAMLRDLAPELQVVVAYGQILPHGVIELSPRGTINVHASLLPRYRGAAPIPWAIVRGETHTGVTTMLIDEGLDTGPLLLSRALPILPEETAADLEGRLARLGAKVLIETLSGLESGTLKPVPQDPAQATFAPLLKKEDGRIDWGLEATDVARRVRGFNPWPGATAFWKGRAFKLLRAQAEEGGRPRLTKDAPGTVVQSDARGLVVACGEGTRLRLIAVHPESRHAMPAAAFAAGARLRVGDRFD